MEYIHTAALSYGIVNWDRNIWAPNKVLQMSHGHKIPKCGYIHLEYSIYILELFRQTQTQCLLHLSAKHPFQWVSEFTKIMIKGDSLSR